MSASLRQEIEWWVTALEAYGQEEPDYATAIAQFDLIGDNSKVLFNIGLIHATVGEHEKAIEAYHRAISLDQYFSVAYFQLGVSNFLLREYKEASANFNDSLLHLRGNSTIQYEQLGLKFTLYSCEVLFNRGLCRLYSCAGTPEHEERNSGLQDLMFASREKQLDAHAVIDEVINDGAEGYTVFSVPVGILFRPSDAKIKNFRHRDYLGEAKVVATADYHDLNTGFDGVEKIRHLEERPTEARSFAATNLVLTDRSSTAISPLQSVQLRDVDFNPQYATPTASPQSSVSAPSGMDAGRDGTVTFRSPSFDGEMKQPVPDLGPVEVAQLKLKIHHGKNGKLRLMLVPIEVDFDEFKMRVEEKLGISGDYVVEIMDNEDMVEISDNDDLNTAIVTSKDFARQAGSAVGTIEIWVTQ
ncbi:hypothetical protein DRE_05383 [Drechslerella stenobrocha 248]|uniref:Uncharacterized protein n=1 Tax=Drechslerella stenobrocha 248 TaxID=1043628 RepID=W7I941_9PEZI|nr:hypothetical protein DRE_05383 [Drechslerella stenobrocha 248]